MQCKYGLFSVDIYLLLFLLSGSLAFLFSEPLFVFDLDSRTLPLLTPAGYGALQVKYLLDSAL